MGESVLISVLPVLLVLLLASVASDASLRRGGGLFRRTGKATTTTSSSRWSAFAKSDSFTDYVEQLNYPVETHTVKTPDKYLLRIHRLPQRQSKHTDKVVLIMHGMFCSSIDWVLIGPGKSLALLLHDQGYDVWLGNARGNTYSRTHSTLNSDSRSFWKFSWHEIGFYDLPTIVSHINRTTEAKQIDYIGHSQGVTTFLVMNILREEYQQYFRTVIAMSPIAFLNHLENPYLRFLAKNSEKVELLLELLKIDELLPSNQLNGMLANLMCSESSPSADLCANLLFLAIGPDPIHLNRTLLPEIFQNIPAGISSRQMLHFGNLVNSGRFQYYDYKQRNMAVYQSRTAPDYPLSRIKGMTFHMYYGTTDTVMAKKDVFQLVDRLKGRNSISVTEIPNFNHLDYIFASNVTEILYRPVFRAMGLLPAADSSTGGVVVAPGSLWDNH